jgi:hypothetical protein
MECEEQQRPRSASDLVRRRHRSNTLPPNAFDPWKMFKQHKDVLEHNACLLKQVHALQARNKALKEQIVELELQLL